MYAIRSYYDGFEGNFSTILPINLTDFDVETMVNEKEVADRGVVIPEKLAEVYFDRNNFV